MYVTFLDASANAQLVGRLFRDLISDLETETLADMLGLEEGET
jgi:hypothetical protein